MADRFKFAEVRQEVIEMLKKDLLGPSSENEILNQNPRFEYIVGMLAPQTSENDSNEQEVDGDASFEGDADYTAGEDDDNEPVFTNRFKTPSSIGISFYLESSTKSFNVDVTWGDYTKASDKTTNKEGKKVDVSTYTRHPQKETVVIDLQEFSKNKEYPLVCDSNVILYISKIGLKQGYTLVTAYVINKRKNPESDIAGMMFQVNLRAYSQDKMDIFVAEHICRKILAVDEFYFAQRPILGRGRGCAATWKANKNGRASEIVSTFIPEYEFPGVSAALEGFDPFFFSMRTLSVAKKKDDIINRLNVLADSYENWIQKKLVHDSKMDDAKFKKEIGDTIINKCIEALGRIRAGIQLLVEDDISFDAFCFMNRSMILQRNIMNFSKKHGAGIECAFRDFVDPRNPSNNFGWRPFQIAFILMNLKGIVDPEHDNREVVDLLYFPTGGGKTEAYLGLMAFVIANRRLRADENDEYNRDGGVTAILRYTLRLLTTQQRDRITKMILAAELIRQKEYPKYGKEPISIGFWVGGTVTPNTFKELEEDPEDPAKTRTARSKKNSIYKQLLTCPFCGKPLTEENFYIDIPTKSVSIYCSDDKCMFYRYKPSNKMKIPVYLVDEEIYAKCPTIILSTVDKFAGLPWDVNTNALFGRVDRICSRDGYVAIGADHARHTRTEELPTATLRSIKPFLPPELIIQDELHLITGPLGTVYGAYETVIEDLCSYTIGGKKIKPKYVVSTATIKNAAEQTKCLYGRKVTAQFPPNGFEIGDSFYIREVPVEQDPFRRYVGVCALGQSVKTALLRVYSIILQSAYNLSLDDEYKDVIDPYYTLVGYYNSIRELGGAVRLLQDDIPDRIQRIKKKYGMSRQRFLNHKVEIGDSFYIREVPVEQDPFRRYVGVCALGQSVKTALLRVYSIILQSAYNLSLDDEYKDVIDPYYTLVGYYNSIRELGGAVRLLQDDIPDRIQRIKKKYGMSRQRFLNHKVEITSRMPSYDIPKKLSQLETPYTDSNCLDTAIATNMIAVGMDVDRLGLMVVTGQPKQNSEYIQATSRIGRSYPGLVVTLYNPYRPRDLSHYENFTGYHAQLYRFVEGTTATPFSARARDRVLHALVISAIRLHYPEFASNDGAAAIDKLTDEQLNEVKALIMNRLNIIKPSAKADAEHEIDDFISNWKLLATQSKGLRYYVYTTKTYNRLMNTYGEVCTDLEKPTLRSMRDVESAANMFYYTED